MLCLTARRGRSKRGCCDTMLIKQLLGEAEGVSSNWLLGRFPVKTVSLKSKCHQSSAAEQPLRNLQVGTYALVHYSCHPAGAWVYLWRWWCSQRASAVLFGHERWLRGLGSDKSFICSVGRCRVSTHHSFPKIMQPRPLLCKQKQQPPLRPPCSLYLICKALEKTGGFRRRI